MKLVIPTKLDCEKVRLWRNEGLVSLRTPYGLTKEMQEKFYDEVVCNPNSPHRYWTIWDEKGIGDDEVFFVGFGGITNIQWENRIGEISLIINPTLRGKGLGEKAVDLLLDKAFNYLNLNMAYGECYLCNEAASFWRKLADKYKGYVTQLLHRKYWDGKYFSALYFSITREDYDKEDEKK